MKLHIFPWILVIVGTTGCHNYSDTEVKGTLTTYVRSGFSTLDLKDANGKDNITLYPGTYTFRMSNMSFFSGTPFVEILDAQGKHKGTVSIPGDTVDRNNNSFEYTTDHKNNPYPFNIRGGLRHERISIWREAQLDQSCTYTVTYSCTVSCTDGNGKSSECPSVCSRQESGTQDVLIAHEKYREYYRILFEVPMLNRTNIAVFNSVSAEKESTDSLSSTTCQ
jgi:hypothetical protein